MAATAGPSNWNSKKDKLLKSAAHYKAVLKKWEDAVKKAEGRNPNKEDLKNAPESIQKSYREFYKIKKVLGSSSGAECIRGAQKGYDSDGRSIGVPSPSRIFIKKKLHTSPGTSPGVRRSPRSIKAIVKSPSSTSTKKAKSQKCGVNFNVFKEKLSFVVNVLGKESSPSKKRRRVEEDRDQRSQGDANTTIGVEITTKTTLRKSSFFRHSSLTLNLDGTRVAPSEAGPSSEGDKVLKETSNVNQGETPEKEDSIASKLNSVSAVWHTFSPSVKTKKKQDSRRVDTKWLRRCDSGHDRREELENDEDEDKIEIDLPTPSKFGDISESDNLPPQPLFSHSFQEFLINSSSVQENEACMGDDSFNTSCGSSKGFDMPDSVNVDSGLGTSDLVFSTEEIMDVIQNEVLPFPSTQGQLTIHNENACFPPDPEQNLQRIPSHGQAGNVESAREELDGNPKKRKSFELSPNPKTPPKKKFFKSTAKTRSKPSYTVSSYKPLTPKKKTASKITHKTKPSISVSTPSLVLVKPSEDSVSPAADEPDKAVLKKVNSKSHEISTSTKQIKKVSKSAGGDNNYFNEDVLISVGRKGKGATKRRKLNNGSSVASRPTRTGNFVKINIEKKKYSRGHSKISGSKTKRDDWKLRNSLASKEDKLKNLTCRKCGESGHFAKFCKKGEEAADCPSPAIIDDSPYPSLAEAAQMANGNGKVLPAHKVNIYSAVPNEMSVEESASELANPESENVDTSLTATAPENSDSFTPMQPYFDSFCEDEYDEILNGTLHEFGYETFRPGQKEAVTRILRGLSTLCVLSTGSGKSLCYQLPAYLYAKQNPGAITLCISPLVSLMEDQVQGIPPFLQAAFLHSNMPSGQKEKVLDKVRQKKLHILLVSPEAVCGGLFGLLRSGDLPQISFACIDEVHCVSQWSHNFRPCYLQLAKILRDKLHVNTILGLTATATEYTANSICETLSMDPSATIRGEIIPLNLNLSASRDLRRDEALLELLRGERFMECDSIIIYCTRRDECQRIASLIRTSLQDISRGITKINSRQRVSTTCEAYHAGMSAGRRRLVQQQFMAGKIRIVVATVAFGMGIDKSDIRSVIHYNMPKTFESYVQEIGRAGRDGLPAQCHLFLDNVKGRDLSELKRHVYCNSIDRPTLRKFLRKVFQPCKCEKVAEFSQTGVARNKNARCPGHEVSFIIEDAVQELDLPQENIMTILCYLELDVRRKWIEMLPHTYQTCKIHSYGGAALLKSAALRCPPLAAAIALQKDKRKFTEGDAYLEFNVIEVSATVGWNSGAVKKELKNLEWIAIDFDGKGNAGKFRKSGLLVEFTDLAFHLDAPGDLTDEESDEVLKYLFGHNQDQERAQLYQLHRVYQSLLSISNNTVESVSDNFDEEKSKSLKKFIHDYFLQKTLEVPSEWKNEVTYPSHQEDSVKQDVRNLLSSVKDVQFTGRSVARIFQGIPSPCFPVEHWGRNRAFWRKHLDMDFHYLCKLAGQEILRF